MVGTHENPVENQRIQCTELNTCDPTSAVCSSLVPSSQSLGSTPFVDKANPDSPVAADPDKPHSSEGRKCKIRSVIVS